MTESDESADRVAHGEASLGDAQADNPPDDPEMLADDATRRIRRPARRSAADALQ